MRCHYVRHALETPSFIFSSQHSSYSSRLADLFLETYRVSAKICDIAETTSKLPGPNITDTLTRSVIRLQPNGTTQVGDSRREIRLISPLPFHICFGSSFSLSHCTRASNSLHSEEPPTPVSRSAPKAFANLKRVSWCDIIPLPLLFASFPLQIGFNNIPSLNFPRSELHSISHFTTKAFSNSQSVYISALGKHLGQFHWFFKTFVYVY